VDGGHRSVADLGQAGRFSVDPLPIALIPIRSKEAVHDCLHPGRHHHHARRRASVPTQPVIPFIEGDGTGPDIWRASQHVFDEAVRRLTAASAGSSGRVSREKSKNRLDSWLPDDTLAAIDHHLVAIKGPLTTPVGRVPLAQRRAPPEARPLRLHPSRALVRGGALPGQGAQDVDMIIFRENTRTSTPASNTKRGATRRAG